jgi:hypothetical protein
LSGTAHIDLLSITTKTKKRGHSVVRRPRHVAQLGCCCFSYRGRRNRYDRRMDHKGRSNLKKVPSKLDYAGPRAIRHWPWWFHLLFATGFVLLLSAFIVVPMFSTANEEFFGIPTGDLYILAVAVFAKVGWELHKWYAGRGGGG